MKGRDRMPIVSKSVPPGTVDLTSSLARINLARSILNNRLPTEHTADLARRALDGASIVELLELDAD